MEEEREILQKYLAEFLPFLTKEVFHVISPEELLDIRGPKVWFQDGRQLQPAEIESLRQEAELFSRSKLWQNLKKQILKHALQDVPRTAKSSSDLVAGKIELYLVNLIERTLRTMTETDPNSFTRISAKAE